MHKHDLEVGISYQTVYCLKIKFMCSTACLSIDQSPFAAVIKDYVFLIFFTSMLMHLCTWLLVTVALLSCVDMGFVYFTPIQGVLPNPSNKRPRDTLAINTVDTCHSLCMISGFHHKVDENCAVLGYYAVSSGNFLLTFCAETLVRNYHYFLRNNPEECSSHVIV